MGLARPRPANPTNGSSDVRTHENAGRSDAPAEGMTPPRSLLRPATEHPQIVAVPKDVAVRCLRKPDKLLIGRADEHNVDVALVVCKEFVHAREIRVLLRIEFLKLRDLRHQCRR